MPVYPTEPPRDLASVPQDAGLFAHIEDLVGQEHALLLIPAHERTEKQRDRLRDIGAELDRITERLRERAERLAGHIPSHQTGS